MGNKEIKPSYVWKKTLWLQAREAFQKLEKLEDTLKEIEHMHGKGVVFCDDYTFCKPPAEYLSLIMQKAIYLSSIIKKPNLE